MPSRTLVVLQVIILMWAYHLSQRGVDATKPVYNNQLFSNSTIRTEKLQNIGSAKQGSITSPALSIFTSPLPLSAVVFVLFVLPFAGFVVWHIFQDKSITSAHFMSATWGDVALFAGYITLFLSWGLLTHFTRDGTHSDAMLMLVTQILKLSFSVILYRVFDGTFKELLADATAGWRSLLYYVLPAALYSISDVMRVDVLRRVEPSTYAVLFNSRMLFLAFVWERVLKRRLNPVHWWGLCLIITGCILKEAPHTSVGEMIQNGFFHDPSRLLAYTEILLMGMFTAVAAVVNEKLLKYEAVPVNLQNFSMYLFSLIPTALLSCSTRFGHAAHVSVFIQPQSTWFACNRGVFDPAEWAAVLMQPMVLAQATNFALFGILTGHFLKRFSNIMREVATGIIILFIIPIDSALFGYAVPLVVCIGAMIVISAIMIFAVSPVPPAPDGIANVKK